MCASAILRFARTIRLPIVGSATRKARAISPVVMPPSARSVSATRAGISSAGWQQVKISRSRSSTIALSSSIDGSSCRASRRCQLGQPLGAIGHRPVPAQAIDRPPPRGGRDPRPRIGRNPVAPPRRDRGLERVLHRVLGQLEVAGLPDQGRQHDRPLLAERARDRSRDRVGRLHAAAHARFLTSSSDTSTPARRAVFSHSLGRHDRTHLDRRPARHRQPRRLLERLVEVRALQHVVAGQDLLGHRERAVDDLGLPVAHADRRRTLRRMQPLDAHQHPGLTQAGVQLRQQRRHLLALGLLGRVDLLFVHQHHVLRHHASDLPALRGIVAQPSSRRRSRRHHLDASLRQVRRR